MSESTTLNGKEYISTKEASKLSGYTSDYIGQLAREGRVASEKVGRRRFVDKEELLSYAATDTEAQEEVVTPAPVVMSQFVDTRLTDHAGDEGDEAEAVTEEVIDLAAIRGAGSDESDEATLARWQTMDDELSDESGVVTTDDTKEDRIEDVVEGGVIEADADTFSIPIRRTAEDARPYFALAAMTVPRPPYYRPAAAGAVPIQFSGFSQAADQHTHKHINFVRPIARVAAVALLVMVTVAGANLYQARFSAGRSITAAAADSYLEAFAVDVYQTIASLFGAHPLPAHQDNPLASSGEKAPLGGTESPSAVVSPTSSQAANGLVVFESPETEAEKQDRINQVKRSFSDDVIVKEDELGGSGTIQPVFRSGKGSEYVYVLVPINGDKTATTSTSSAVGTP